MERTIIEEVLSGIAAVARGSRPLWEHQPSHYLHPACPDEGFIYRRCCWQQPNHFICETVEATSLRETAEETKSCLLAYIYVPCPPIPPSLIGVW